MIVWILMFLDLIVLGIISLAQFNIAFLVTPLIISAIYLTLKTLVFRDLMSMIDLVVAIYIIIMLVFHTTSFVYYIILGWFLYKLFFTLI